MSPSGEKYKEILELVKTNPYEAIFKAFDLGYDYRGDDENEDNTPYYDDFVSFMNGVEAQQSFENSEIQKLKEEIEELKLHAYKCPFSRENLYKVPEQSVPTVFTNDSDDTQRINIGD